MASARSHGSCSAPVGTTLDSPDRYEAYDLDIDPDELNNWANDPSRTSERDALEAALDALLLS